MNLTKGILLAVTFMVVFFSSFLAVYIERELSRPLVVSEPTFFEVKRGATIGSVAHSLTELDVLPVSNRLFRYYGGFTGDDGPIRVGEYQLVPGMDTRGLLQLLRSGKVRQRQITFPEGWTFLRWRDHIRAKQDIKQTLESVTDSGLMNLIGYPRLHPEGQFFPDTYHYTKGEADIDILRRAHEKMKSVVEDQWQSRTIGEVLESPYEALILASIVEKETGFPPDRSPVARVFLNRLSKNIRLQSDPTVIYGLGPDFDGNLRRSHLKDDHPYNTYVHEALPPTPICMPGKAAITATLHAEPGAYQFFVAKGDGSSHFSMNLAEHNEAVRQYQKQGRISDYRSSHP